MRLSENRRKSLDKYTKKIVEFENKGRLEPMCANARLGYWQYKIYYASKTETMAWDRVFFLADRAARGNKVVLPKELEGKVNL